MISNEIAAGLLDRLLSEGGDYAEIFVQDKVIESVTLDESRIEGTTTGTERGVGIRLIKGGKEGYAHTNSFDSAVLNELARDLRVSVAIASESVKPMISDERAIAKIEPEINPFDLDIASKTEMLRAAEEAARAEGKFIVQVMAIYGSIIDRRIIFNSLGASVDQTITRSRLRVSAIATKDGVIQTGYEVEAGTKGLELFEGNKPYEMGRNAAKQALLMLTARESPARSMPVVIEKGTGGVLFHEACGHSLEADTVRKDASVFVGKTGRQVASSEVSAYDDSTKNGLYGTFCFDDEGTEAQKTPLIEGGILSGFMVDRKQGLLLEKASTGNGRRESYKSISIPRMSNTYILPGRENINNIIEDTKYGFYAKKLGGGEVNPATGDFIFSVTEGYLIEKGAVTEPLRGATLIGNGPSVLMDIDAVAEEIGYEPGLCGKDGQAVPVTTGQPALRVKSMTIGGRG